MTTEEILEAKTEEGEEAPVAEKPVVEADPNFSELKQTAPGLGQMLEDFWPYYKKVLKPQEERDKAPVVALEKFLKRLDIALSVKDLSEMPEAILQSWNWATTTVNFDSKRLLHEHKGNLRHTNTFAAKVLDYDALIWWSKALKAASLLVCGRKPLNKSTAKIPAMLLQESRNLNLPPKSFMIEAEISWTRRLQNFLAEDQIGSLRELTLAVEGKKEEKDTQGYPDYPALLVKADYSEIRADFTLGYRKMLPQIIKIIKPRHAVLSLEWEDVQKWITRAGFIRRIWLRRLIRGKKNKPVRIEVPFSWVDDCGSKIGLDLLSGSKRDATYVTGVSNDRQDPGEILKSVQMIAGFSDEAMPWEEFVIFGKTGPMYAEEFYKEGFPTHGEVQQFVLQEGEDISGGGFIRSEFLKPAGEPRDSAFVVFAASVYPENSAIRDFQEKVLIKLGIAAPEDASEN